MLISAVIFIIILCVLGVPAAFLLLRWKYASQKTKTDGSKLKVGIFHPYCNAGGGGEKVLWVAVEALQKKYPQADFYVYTGDIEATPDEILSKVSKTLNVNVDKKVKFVYLNKRKWLEPHMYPYFTLLGQSLGSIYLGFEALNQLNPGITLIRMRFSIFLVMFCFCRYFY